MGVKNASKEEMSKYQKKKKKGGCCGEDHDSQGSHSHGPKQHKKKGIVHMELPSNQKMQLASLKKPKEEKHVHEVDMKYAVVETSITESARD